MFNYTLKDGLYQEINENQGLHTLEEGEFFQVTWIKYIFLSHGSSKM